MTRRLAPPLPDVHGPPLTREQRRLLEGDFDALPPPVEIDDPTETPAQRARRELGPCPMHPFNPRKPGHTVCLSVEGGCPACYAVIHWRKLRSIVEAMEADERRLPAPTGEKTGGRFSGIDKRLEAPRDPSLYPRAPKQLPAPKSSDGGQSAIVRRTLQRHERREQRKRRKRPARTDEDESQGTMRTPRIVTASKGPLPLHCRGCGASCERCSRLVSRKCCPDCTCGAWCDLQPRQLGLPWEQRCLNLESMLNAETLSSISSVTGRSL